MPTLAQLIYSKDDEVRECCLRCPQGVRRTAPCSQVLIDACWALSYLSDDTGPNNQKIQAVIQCGVARRLVELLMHRRCCAARSRAPGSVANRAACSPNVVTPALRTVGNIVTGDDLQTQVILNCAVLPCLLHLLNNGKRGKPPPPLRFVDAEDVITRVRMRQRLRRRRAGPSPTSLRATPTKSA